MVSNPTLYLIGGNTSEVIPCNFLPYLVTAGTIFSFAYQIITLYPLNTRGDRHSSRVEAKNPALLSNRDGYPLELTGWTQGSQAS